MRKKVTVISTVCVITGLILFNIISNFKIKEFSVMRPKVLNYTPYISVSGKIEANQTKTLYTSSKIYVEKVNYKIGDKVKKGDIIARLDSSKKIETTFDSYSKILDFIEKFKDTQTVDTDILKLLPELSQIVGGFSTSKYSDIINDNENELISPINGVITRLNIDDQNYSNNSDIAVEICDMSSMKVRVNVSENAANKIKLNQQVVITSDSFERYSFSGFITMISPVAVQTTSILSSTNTVEILITIENPTNVLKPGYSANVKIYTDKTSEILTIPYESVLQDDNNNEYVWVENNGRAKKCIVKTGLALSGGLEVISGIKEEDKILIGNYHNLKENKKIKIKEE